MAELKRIHPLAPLYDGNCRALVLGTLPSPLSRKNHLFYGNPRNRFWAALSAVFDEELPQSADGKRAMALRHHVAITDVIASGDIVGASDASIKNPVPNDFTAIFATCDIRAIFTTGAKATELYRKLCEPMTGRPCIGLPSTSPANAAWSLERLIERYRAIAVAVDGGDPQTYLEGLERP